MEIDVQAQNANEQCPVVGTASDGPSGMTKIVPSSDDVSGFGKTKYSQNSTKEREINLKNDISFSFSKIAWYASTDSPNWELCGNTASRHQELC